MMSGSLRRLHVLIVCFTIAFAAPLVAQVGTGAVAYMEQHAGWDGTYRAIRVPILMYHYVSELPELADEVRVNLTVSPDTFRAHMEYLFYEGYTTISLYQLYDALLQGTPLPPKPIVLTFDDGYVDHYTTVYPILREYGFTGTFFIITGPVDNANENYLSWSQVTEMARNGMSMESHTRDHPELIGRDYDFLVYQLLGAQESLAAYTGLTPHMFAYPVGRYDDATLAVLRSMSTWIAVTTENGLIHYSDQLLEMPRLRISNGTGVGELAGILGADR
jgi:peptidoglycan/xylan/chitin deacetylase (PgdA/CDA1 family)